MPYDWLFTNTLVISAAKFARAETEAREVSNPKRGREKYVSKNETLSSKSSDVSCVAVEKSVVADSMVTSDYPITALYPACSCFAVFWSTDGQLTHMMQVYAMFSLKQPDATSSDEQTVNKIIICTSI